MADQIGEITILHGTAIAESPDGSRELSLGSPIYNNDVISTESKSALEIQFTDGAVLSQGANSKVHLDDYVFDPDADAGEVTMNLLEGTFRSVTGQIVDMNPEGFKIDTPSTTIGIRGTTTAHEISPEGEETHVVLDFDGKPVVFTSQADGRVQVITRDGFKITATPEGISPVERASANEIARFEQLSTESMQESAPDYPELEDETGDQESEPENEDNGDGAEASGDSAEGDNTDGEEVVAEGEGEEEIAATEEIAEEVAEEAPEETAATGAVVEAMGSGSFGGESETTSGGLLEGDEGSGAVGGVTGELETDGVSTNTLGIDFGETSQSIIVGLGDEDETEEEQVVVDPTLDRSTFGADLTAVLTNTGGYYHATATPSDKTSISSEVKNIIGDENHNNHLTGNDDDNQLTGGNANDTLSSSADDIIYGGVGNDTIFGSGGSDSLFGDGDYDYLSYENLVTGTSNGVDVCLTTNSVDKKFGTVLTDTISGFEAVYGTNDKDTLYADGNDNYLNGNGGNDTIWGHGGVDTMYGGGGDDKFKFHTYNPDTGTEIYGGDGNDFISVYGTSDLSGLTTVDSVENLEFIAACTVTANAEIFPMAGTIKGNSGGADKLIINANGTDAFNYNTYSMAGITLTNWDSVADSIEFNGTAYKDLIQGSAGKDIIDGKAGNDIIYGGLGNDALIGNDGNDRLEGQTGLDNLSGGLGDDYLFGGLGADTLNGGAGRDTFYYSDTTDASMVEMVSNFSHNDDTFEFKACNFGFTAGTTLDAGQFYTSAAAMDDTNASFYTSGGAILYYDADGNGAGAAVEITDYTLADGAIDHTDITFVA